MFLNIYNFRNLRFLSAYCYQVQLVCVLNREELNKLKFISWDVTKICDSQLSLNESPLLQKCCMVSF